MMISPIKYLSLLLIRTIFKNFNLFSSYGTLYKFIIHLLSTSLTLIKTVGFIPVFRVLWSLRKVINGKLGLTVLRYGYYLNLNRLVLNTILDSILPFLDECMKLKYFKFIYNLLLFPIIISSFRIFSFTIMRIVFGTILKNKKKINLKEV